MYAVIIHALVTILVVSPMSVLITPVVDVTPAVVPPITAIQMGAQVLMIAVIPICAIPPIIVLFMMNVL